MIAAYREADLFVMASRIAADGDRDGLPNVLMEAGSQELAAVTTSVSAVPELITDGENGLLVPPDQPEALAAALESADPRSRTPSNRWEKPREKPCWSASPWTPASIAWPNAAQFRDRGHAPRKAA